MINSVNLPGALDALAASTTGPIRFAHPDVATSSPMRLPVLSQALADGRAMRGLYDVESVHARSLEITQWASAGEEQRLAGNIPSEFVCFGDSAVCTSREWGRFGQFVVLRDAAVVASFVSLFDRLWDSAIGLEGSVDTTSYQLVDLLAQGLQDDEIAKHLGISMRQLRKRIDALMRECGARTRFEMALVLAERGMVGTSRFGHESGWLSR